MIKQLTDPDPDNLLLTSQEVEAAQDQVQVQAQDQAQVSSKSMKDPLALHFILLRAPCHNIETAQVISISRCLSRHLLLPIYAGYDDYESGSGSTQEPTGCIMGH